MGPYVLGIASLILGLAGLVLSRSGPRFSINIAFSIVTSVALAIGGSAMLFDRSRRLGAILLAFAYLVSTLTLLPAIVSHPSTYAVWGNTFYTLALVAGAVAVFAAPTFESSRYMRAACKGAVVLFGLCNLSFGFEQLEFLHRTVGLVPKWMPGGGPFWAYATTLAFWLAGISIVVGYKSELACRLVAAMLLIFGVTIWIPILIVDPRTHSNWGEGLETFAIAGAAWILADVIRSSSLREPKSALR